MAHQQRGSAGNLYTTLCILSQVWLWGLGFACLSRATSFNPVTTPTPGGTTTPLSPGFPQSQGFLQSPGFSPGFVDPEAGGNSGLPSRSTRRPSTSSPGHPMEMLSPSKSVSFITAPPKHHTPGTGLPHLSSPRRHSTTASQKGLLYHITSSKSIADSAGFSLLRDQSTPKSGYGSAIYRSLDFTRDTNPSRTAPVFSAGNDPNAPDKPPPLSDFIYGYNPRRPSVSRGFSESSSSQHSFGLPAWRGREQMAELMETFTSHVNVSAMGTSVSELGGQVMTPITGTRPQDSQAPVAATTSKQAYRSVDSTWSGYVSFRGEHAHPQQPYGQAPSGPFSLNKSGGNPRSPSKLPNRKAVVGTMPATGSDVRNVVGSTATMFSNRRSLPTSPRNSK